MNELILTEKQHEVLIMRYEKHAKIDQIAQWLHISRRAVLARLRNARRRLRENGSSLPRLPRHSPRADRIRTMVASQLEADSL